MFSTTKFLGSFAMAVVLGGCGGAEDAGGQLPDDDGVNTSTEPLANNVTTTRVVFVCSESTAFALIIDAGAPTAVSPSESFPVTVRVRDFFIFPTPLAGTLTASQTVLASNAAPATSQLALPALHFPEGQPILDLGTGSTTLTAASAAGSPVVLTAGNFAYTIVPDDPVHNTVIADCVAADPDPATLVVIPIVQTPTSKESCKNGGWRQLTDDEGTPFRNQGACIKFVQHS